MHRRISLARRNLLQDRRRALLSISGVSAALLLVIVLDGVLAGAMRQVTAYIRSSPADIFVSQADVRTMHMSQSSLAPELVDKVTAMEGVEWAAGLRYTSSILDAGDGQLTTDVFGYDVATGRGGPQALLGGRPPGSGELVIDETAAQELACDSANR